METSALKVTLIIDMASNIVKDPLNHTRVGKQRKPILERQNVSQNNIISIPPPYLSVGGLELRDLCSIVHIPSIEGPVPQVIITIFQNSLGTDGRERSSGNPGGGGRRHGKMKLRG